MTPPPTLVCLHGLGRTAADWDATRDALSAFGDVQAPQLPRAPTDAFAAASAAVRTGDVVIGHSWGGVLALRLAQDTARPLRAAIVTGCFFRPARNGRSTLATVRDYAAHRVAFVRALDRTGSDGGRASGSAGALAALVRLAARPARDDAALRAITAPVLVVHARDDHHVPADFAIAAAARNPGWALELLAHGGHHAHVHEPAAWLAAVVPWLTRELALPADADAGPAGPGEA